MATAMVTAMAMGATAARPAAGRAGTAAAAAAAAAAAGGRRWESTTLFDVEAKAVQKARAAMRDDAERFEYIRDHLAGEVVERLYDIRGELGTVLDLFCGNAHILRALRAHEAAAAAAAARGGARKVGRLLQADVHERVVRRAAAHADGGVARAADVTVFREGDALPARGGSLDAVVSAGALHWVNDLPALLRAVRGALRDEGVFVGALLGGDTLHELRASLALADDELFARAAARTSPTVRVQDAARLLGAAQLALPTVDVDRVVVTYGDMWSVMAHVRAMGEGNALRLRRHWAGRRLLQRAAAIYAERFAARDGSGGVEATFEMMYLIGWKRDGGGGARG